MSALLALLAALVLGLGVPPHGAFHRVVTPAAPAGGSAAPAHRVVVSPMDVFGGPGM